MVITTSIDYDKRMIADGLMRGHVDTQLSFFLVTTTYMMVWNGFLNVPFTHRPEPNDTFKLYLRVHIDSRVKLYGELYHTFSPLMERSGA
jgi:hypothetical protein